MNNVKLNQVCKILNGFAFKSDEYQNSGVPLLRISNFDDGTVVVDEKSIFVDKDFLKTKSDFIVEKGDILIALSGATTGKYGIYNYDFPSLLNQRIGLLKSSTSSKMYGNYFYHFLNILKDEILRKAGGAAQPNISTKTIGELQIPLPPLEQQKKIAEILDNADTYRQLTKALIAKYDELTQSLFLDMFGDPVKNEKGWEFIELKKCTTKIGSGSTPRGGKESYQDSGISLIRSMNIYDNQFKYENLAFISDEQADKLKNVTVERDDVLFNITGASVCRCSVVPENVLPARVNQHVSILRAKTNLILPKFLMHVLISENVKRNLLKVGSAGGAIMEAITKEQLEKYEIPVPSLILQNQFAERVQAIETQKAQAQASLEKAEELFNSLLQRAFKGELG
jgi:type I restriction enzyme S subunit